MTNNRKDSKNFSYICPVSNNFYNTVPISYTLTSSMYRLMHSGASKSIQSSIEAKLTQALNPIVLKVTNESHMHRGHAGVQGSTSTETHFDIEVVSDTFTSLSRVARQRLVNNLLKEEFDNGLHAVAMRCKAPNDV